MNHRVHKEEFNQKILHYLIYGQYGFLWNGMIGFMTLQVRSAYRDEMGQVLRMLFQHRPQTQRKAVEQQYRQQLELGWIDPEGFLVVVDTDRQILGAIGSQVLPGNTAIVLPPQVEQHPRPMLLKRHLIDALLVRLRKAGCVLAQMFLEPEEHPLAEPLLETGFQCVTQIYGMRKILIDRPSKVPIGLNIQPGNPESKTFQHVLMQTYVNTLDCPELNDKRTVEQIIAGFRSSSPRADQWWHVQHHNQWIGVLILADTPQPATWEIAYFGLIPEVRGKGYGRQVMHWVLEQAWQKGIRQLHLIVDMRNQPAYRIYQSFGFEVFDVREVFLNWHL